MIVTNNHSHFKYPEYIAPTDLSVANILAHGGNIPFCDYQEQEFEVGQVVFFEHATSYGALPRKGRIVNINPNKQKIKVLSDNSGGYNQRLEGEPDKEGYYKFGVYRYAWREFWIGMEACPIIIGTKDQKIYDC